MSSTPAEPNPVIHAVYDYPAYELGQVGEYFAAVEDLYRISEAMAYSRETGVIHPTLFAAPWENVRKELARWQQIQAEREEIDEWITQQETRAVSPWPEDPDVHVALRKRGRALQQRDLMASLADRLEERIKTNRVRIEDKGYLPGRLIIRRLRLASPLDITIVIMGVPAAAAFAAHLLSRFLKDPEIVKNAERLGGLLPRFAANWHLGKAELDDAKRVRLESEQALYRTAEKVSEKWTEIEPLKPKEITVANAGDEPDEIAHAFTD